MTIPRVESSPSCRKWVVMFSSFCSLFLGAGVSYTSGVYHVAFLDCFRQDGVQIAWLGSLFCSMFALTGPLASLTVNLFSCRICVMSGSLLILLGFTLSSFITDMRWLFLTYAFLPGLGEGMVYVGSQVILSFYFPGQLSVVTGIGLAGLALGVFVFPPLIQLLLDHYGLKGGFLMTGALSFQTAVFGALMKPCSSEIEAAKSKTSNKTSCQKFLVCLVGEVDSAKELLKPSFILFLFSCFCFGVGNYITYIFLPDYFIHRGSSRQEAALLLSVAGIGGTFSRLFSGIAAHDVNIGPLILFVGTHIVAAILDFIITLLTASLAGKIAYSFMFGIYASAAWPLLSPITMRIVGKKNFISAFGVVMFACGLGILTGPPAARWVAELYGNYEGAYFLAGSSFMMTSVCGIMLALPTQHGKGENARIQVDADPPKGRI